MNIYFTTSSDGRRIFKLSFLFKIACAQDALGLALRYLRYCQLIHLCGLKSSSSFATGCRISPPKPFLHSSTALIPGVSHLPVTDGRAGAHQLTFSWIYSQGTQQWGLKVPTIPLFPEMCNRLILCCLVGCSAFPFKALLLTSPCI